MLKNLPEPIIEFKKYGFIYHNNDFTRAFEWDRITKVIAYKADLITSDDIRIQVFENEDCIILTENYSFFKAFNQQMLEALPEIKKNWFEDIAHPAFEDNTTVLYFKENQARNDLNNSR